MINLNELRIGNYVDRLYCNPNPGHEGDEKEICKVVSVKQLTVNIELKYTKTIIKKYSLSNLFPIPLTPEILEKCGFIGDGFLELENGIILCYTENEFILHAEDLNNLIQYYLPHIKYLHQLQNLYWSLCGKELEIKDLT